MMQSLLTMARLTADERSRNGTGSVEAARSKRIYRLLDNRRQARARGRG